MTISSDRQEVIDFTQPYMTFGLAFIIRVKDVSANYFRFLLPFDKSLWIALCVLIMVMSLLVWVCSVVSPWGYYGRCVQVEAEEKVNEMKADPTPHGQLSRHALTTTTILMYLIIPRSRLLGACNSDTFTDYLFLVYLCEGKQFWSSEAVTSISSL